MRNLLLAFTCTLVLALVACAAFPERPRLYDQLGGQQGIAEIVEGLLFRLVENPRIGHHFANTDLFRLREKLIEQFCVEAAGPCVYTGDPMELAHAGLDLTEADFNALVEDLLDTMEALQVPVAAQNRLIARLAPMRGDIIGK